MKKLRIAIHHTARSGAPEKDVYVFPENCLIEFKIFERGDLHVAWDDIHGSRAHVYAAGAWQTCSHEVLHVPD